jgi:hypothetical protein
MIRNLLLIFVLLFFVSAARAQSFNSDDELKKPVRIPAGILRQLEETEKARACIENGEEEKFEASWFKAVRVDLNGDKFADYLVKSDKGCLDGPRAATWWIFRGGPGGFTAVFEDSVLTLSIKKGKTRGLRNVVTETTMMNIIRNDWRFNGKRYVIRNTQFIEVS